YELGFPSCVLKGFHSGPIPEPCISHSSTNGIAFHWSSSDHLCRSGGGGSNGSPMRTRGPIPRRKKRPWSHSLGIGRRCFYASNLLAALLFPHRRLAVGASHFEHAIVRRIAFPGEGVLDG